MTGLDQAPRPGQPLPLCDETSDQTSRRRLDLACRAAIVLELRGDGNRDQPERCGTDPQHPISASENRLRRS